MALSSFRSHLDKIAKDLLPEERVRQALFRWMVLDLGYPKQSIALEKSISDLCPGYPFPLPRRRVDLIVFDRGLPYLLVECKNKRITAQAKRQLLSYNYIIKSPRIALASHQSVEMAQFFQGDWHWQEGLLEYLQI